MSVIKVLSLSFKGNIAHLVQKNAAIKMAEFYYSIKIL